MRMSYTPAMTHHPRTCPVPECSLVGMLRDRFSQQHPALQLALPGSGQYACLPGCDELLTTNPQFDILRPPVPPEVFMMETIIQHGDRPEAKLVLPVALQRHDVDRIQEWLERVHAYEREGARA